MRGAGLDDARAVEVYQAFLSWVLGFVIIELRQVVDNPDDPEPVVRLGLHRLPARDFPHMRALGPQLAVQGGEERLIAGLDALLDHLTP